MVNKLDEQTFTSEFEFHSMPHSYGLVPHLSKALNKLLLINWMGASGGVMVNKLDLQTLTSEFDSHWVPHSFGILPHLTIPLCKFLLFYWSVFFLFSSLLAPFYFHWIDFSHHYHEINRCHLWISQRDFKQKKNKLFFCLFLSFFFVYQKIPLYSFPNLSAFHHIMKVQLSTRSRVILSFIFLNCLFAGVYIIRCYFITLTTTKGDKQNVCHEQSWPFPHTTINAL